jgi:DNA-binding transcriptional LysR family regulator
MNALITPHLLQTFRKAYEIQNFTEAAEKLGMTQSGVSQHIAQIEATIGSPLFERVGRGLRPTKTGEKLYAFGGKWLSQMEDFVEEVRNGEQSISGRVTFGAPGSFGVYVLPALIEWQRNHPGLILEIEYGPNSVMENELKVGRLDLAISSEPLDSRYYVNQEFYNQEFVLVSHPSLNIDLSSWDKFSKTPIVDYVGSENIFQRWLLAHFGKEMSAPTSLNVRAKINNMESIFLLLQKKVGATIFPKDPLIEFVHKKKLKIHETKKVVSNPLYLVRRQGQAFSHRIQSLHEAIMKQVEGD